MFPNNCPPTHLETLGSIDEQISDADYGGMIGIDPNAMTNTQNITNIQDSEQNTTYATAIADALKWTCLHDKMI